MKTKLCILLSLLWFSIFIKAQPTLTLSSSDSVICAGESVTLTVATPILYNWCYWAAGSSSSSKTIAISPLSDTLVTVTCLENHGSLTASFTQSVFICTGIEHRFGENPLSLAPNPATDRLLIGGLPSESELTLCTTLGAEIFRSKCVQQSVELNVSDLVPGIYYLLIEAQRFKVSRKILVE